MVLRLSFVWYGAFHLMVIFPTPYKASYFSAIAFVRMARDTKMPTLLSSHWEWFDSKKKWKKKKHKTELNERHAISNG